MITAEDSLTNKPDPTLVDVANDQRKISTLNGNAEIILSDEVIGIANKVYGLLVSNIGNILKGPTHITDTPSSIRINGFWVMNDDLLSTLPSTTYTPIPVLVYKESPYVKMVKGFVSSLSGT